MDHNSFEDYINDAVESLPSEFKQKLNNVAIVIEDYPTQDQLIQAKVGRGLLLGLYQGVPQTARGTGYGIGGTLPDKITIFKYPILSIASSSDEIIRLIKKTVLHEIAHHFGMDEEMVRKAENKLK